MKQVSCLLSLAFLLPLACQPRGYNAASDTNATDGTSTSATSADATYGFNKDKTCEQYVASNFYQGATAYEVASIGLGAKVKYTTTITAVNGTNVTIKTLVVAPMSDDIIDESVFDMCSKDTYITALPAKVTNCKYEEVGYEDIDVNKVKYHAMKLKSVGTCIEKDTNKTFIAEIWRVPELPLLGIIKRELSGGMFRVDLSLETKTWSPLKN